MPLTSATSVLEGSRSRPLRTSPRPPARYEKEGVVVFGRPREIELNLSGLAELRATRERSERADALMAEL